MSEVEFSFWVQGRGEGGREGSGRPDGGSSRPTVLEDPLALGDFRGWWGGFGGGGVNKGEGI